jgi:hypothetical protein
MASGDLRQMQRAMSAAGLLLLQRTRLPCAPVQQPVPDAARQDSRLRLHALHVETPA